jgi:hypothetical protein
MRRISRLFLRIGDRLGSRWHRLDRRGRLCSGGAEAVVLLYILALMTQTIRRSRGKPREETLPVGREACISGPLTLSRFSENIVTMITSFGPAATSGAQPKT